MDPQCCHIILNLLRPQSSAATCGFQFHLLPVPPPMPMAICPRAIGCMRSRDHLPILL